MADPVPTLSLIDSHCHLDHPRMADPPDVIVSRAREAGVREMITIESGWTLADNERVVAIAREHAGVHAVVGVHPHDAAHLDDVLLEGIRQLSAAPEVVGIGETGLDYHYDNSPRDVQRAAFRRWIRLAREVDLPLVVHTRSAEDDTLAVFDEEPPGDIDVVIHCFSGTRAFADACLERGFHLSIPGIVTFKNAGDLPDVAASAPIDRLLVETDSPYLAPMPHRGRPNEPAYVTHTAARVAELRGMDPQALAEATAANARRVFRLPELM